MNTNENYQQLGYAVAVQAIRDFFNGSKKNKDAVIKDLKSPWMDLLTNGLSLHLAKELETNPKQVLRRFNKALAKQREEI